MAKRFKLRLSLPSFQLCRSRKQTTLPQTPLPEATYMFSPINPKSIEIAYPNSPNPPPSTPNHISIIPNSSKVTPIGSSCKSTSQIEFSHHRKTTNPLISEESESGWFSSETDETESVISTSLSFDSSNFESGCPLERIDDRPRRKRKTNLRVRRLKRCVSKISEIERGFPVRKSVFWRMMMTCAVEGKVRDSIAVVKKSVDPYEDFKRSMLEMILEKQMFEANDLEQLLQCFLSLNSRYHHKAIVEAFAEIWELLFCESS